MQVVGNQQNNAWGNRSNTPKLRNSRIIIRTTTTQLHGLKGNYTKIQYCNTKSKTLFVFLFIFLSAMKYIEFNESYLSISTNSYNARGNTTTIARVTVQTPANLCESRFYPYNYHSNPRA